MNNPTQSGVDIIDKSVSIHSAYRKSKKWWKSIFFYYLDVTIHNSSIIYFSSNTFHSASSNNKSLSFRKLLLKGLINYFDKNEKITINNNPIIIRGAHFLILIGLGPKKCQNCKSNKNKTNKSNNYKRSIYKCNKCNIILCQNCFENLHKEIK